MFPIQKKNRMVVRNFARFRSTSQTSETITTHWDTSLSSERISCLYTYCHLVLLSTRRSLCAFPRQRLLFFCRNLAPTKYKLYDDAKIQMNYVWLLRWNVLNLSSCGRFRPICVYINLRRLLLHTCWRTMRVTMPIRDLSVKVFKSTVCLRN